MKPPKPNKIELSKRQQLIRQRRSQMLIHSCLYYKMDTTIVDDATWQKWADELEELQKNKKDIKIDFFDKEFEDWTGATGCHLPHTDSWVYAKALALLDYHNKLEKK